MKEVLKRCTTVLATTIGLTLGVYATSAHAWDHPAHMTTAAIAYNEVKRRRPEPIEAICRVFLARPPHQARGN
jgi:hypothetical protein